MQNFRKEESGIRKDERNLWDKLGTSFARGIRRGRKTMTCVLSAAMAAIVFWVFPLSSRQQNLDEMTVAERIHLSGDILTASADPSKFTGRTAGSTGLGSSLLAGTFLEINGQQLSKVSELAKELAGSYLGSEEESIDPVESEPHESESPTVKRAEVRAESMRSVNSANAQTRRVEQEEILEHPVEERLSSLLRPGQQQVLWYGADGKQKVVYEQKIVDGEVQEQKVVSQTVLQEPIAEIRLVGASGVQAAISPLDFGIELDEQGVPVQYSKVLTNQVATGYSAGQGAWGASGQTLSAGYVAVHPGEIPYGTKMYITSPDNSFVYGFAIAADTGTALLGDIIDVDLYYDSYLESCLNGRRNVNIYILD